MCPAHPPPAPENGRRRFLSRVITTIQGAIGATLAFVLGGAVASPAPGTRRADWLPAADVGSLPMDEPTPVTVRVTREDGYHQVVDRQVVFLVRTGDSDVMALSSVCTHLGCRVRWDASEQTLKCPCHGGIFDRTGAVKAGPPPSPLEKLPTRLEGDQVLVQL